MASRSLVALDETLSSEELDLEPLFELTRPR
jgi:hypothetical protein